MILNSQAEEGSERNSRQDQYTIHIPPMHTTPSCIGYWPIIHPVTETGRQDTLQALIQDSQIEERAERNSRQCQYTTQGCTGSGPNTNTVQGCMSEYKTTPQIVDTPPNPTHIIPRTQFNNSDVSRGMNINRTHI